MLTGAALDVDKILFMRLHRNRVAPTATSATLISAAPGLLLIVIAATSTWRAEESLDGGFYAVAVSA